MICVFFFFCLVLLFLFFFVLFGGGASFGTLKVLSIACFCVLYAPSLHEGRTCMLDYTLELYLPCFH